MSRIYWWESVRRSLVWHNCNEYDYAVMEDEQYGIREVSKYSFSTTVDQ